MYDLVLIGIVLFIASIIDIKTEEVPDWLSIGLVVIGLVISVVLSIMQKDIMPFAYSAAGAGALFLGGYLLYRAGQWGGGDAKLIAGVGAVLGIKSMFLYAFLFNILIAGGILGVFFTLYIMFKKRYVYKRPRFFAVVTIFVIAAAVSQFLVNPVLGLLILLTYSIYLLVPLLKDSDNLMRKDLAVSKLVEGDWLLKAVKKGRKEIVSVKKIGLTTEDIEILKEHNIKKVVLKQGMPFVPSFFIAYLLALYFGNIFFVVALL